MSVTERGVFADAELLDLLSDHPDLLAIADAVAATQRRPGRRRLRLPHAAFAAAFVTLAVALALVAPWERGSGGIVQRALAAIGDGQVIHVVTRSVSSQPIVVDLTSGTERQTVVETELWFDGTRKLERTVTRVNGRVADETLQTPQGGWTSSGPIYTCAWIAAHPAEATKLRISCNPNGDNGTTPRQVPEQPPTLDPALAGFVSGYRDALAGGDAKRAGTGEVEGRPVEWVEFEPRVTVDPITGADLPRVEQVAVDRDTGKPLLVRTLVGGRVEPGSQVSITTAETLAPEQASFAKPAPLGSERSPTFTGVVSSQPTDPREAAARFGGRAVWAGKDVEGLALTRATIDTLSIGFGPGSGRSPTRAEALQLLYGERPADLSAFASSRFVSIRESFQPALGYGYLALERAPSPGSLVVNPIEVSSVPKQGGRAVATGVVLWQGQTRVGDSYVQLEASSKDMLIKAAQSLVPIPEEAE